MKTSRALPIKFNLGSIFVSSIVITLLMIAASIAGLIYPEELYPTNAMREAYLVNDALNLLIGVPIMFVTMWLAKRGKLVGLLLWPGALFFVFYNYIAYIFGIPYNRVYGLYILILTASLYTIISLVASIKGAHVKGLLSSSVPVRLSGGVLTGLGVLFAIRAVAILIEAIVNKDPIPMTELAVLIADMLIAPAWIIGGIALWRRMSFGYVSGLGLLFQGTTLFIGLILLMVLQPVITGAQYSYIDILVVFIMGFIVFIPFGLFLKGVFVSKQAV